MKRFENRVVIVTGAGSGIGAAAARRFAAEGARVVLAGRTREKLEKVAADLPADKQLVHVTDVSDYEQVEGLVRAAVDRFGRLDVMVNNAGVASEGRATEDSFEAWHKVISIDLEGVFHGARAALPHLIKTKGSIVNTASVSGLGADWNMAFYNTAKGGVVNLTRSLALDYGREGVRINSVCPSLTRTDMTVDMFKDEQLVEKFRERIALGRTAEPEDIADVIAFLASEDARFVTGVNLPVDGGLSASNGQPPQ
ncbi:SDR family NAD(P)-dependent oxidoreductase [Cupriavidus plantarum]|uniref:SDR family NAD(P)-dependent oxidoreductase n=1 Tax=Cupriavidus plantarum TaxID=942865 RepID=UPI000E22F750|nr:SDR family oxidoreductase [Cupriavidus plantarum]REE87563.1 meso-butanediol dehydrogenase/(S,S)-butanediol dehydrogenase/diacetyl reductase [Cupriavidus plantarum]RLK29996.1 meso-butanediol dehydrogenase/(S,S)-butanediol dehydrogenase/diacetyl reductase [Cupriavidus plantarum]